MEHQEPRSVAKRLPPSPIFDEVDADDDDDEYKVESDADPDDTDSDDADDQEALPFEEETLHLPDIADDLLGGLEEEEVLSDSECVESDIEDEDEEGGADAIASHQQQPAMRGMGERTAEQTPQQGRPALWEAAEKRAGPAGQVHGLDRVDAEPAEGRGAPAAHFAEAQRQRQWAGTSSAVQQPIQQHQQERAQGHQCRSGLAAAWAGSLGSDDAATPMQQRNQQPPQYATGAALEPRLATVGESGGISTPATGRDLQQHQQPSQAGYLFGDYAREPQQLQHLLDVGGQASLASGMGVVHGVITGSLQLQPQQQLQREPEQRVAQHDREGGRLACPPSGGICRRTRAHVSLRDVELSELEQQLPAHIDIEEVELAEDDEEYGKFLQALFDDTAALPEDSSDEDPDFAAELDFSRDEEDEDDRDWLRLLNSPEREKGGTAGGPVGPAADSPARRTRARSRRANTKGDAAAAPASGNVGEAVGFPEMTAEQLSMLHAQLHCHTQMLVQTYAMFLGDRDGEAQDLAAKAKAMLAQLSLARDAQAEARKAVGLPHFTPEDLLLPAPSPPPPAAPAASGAANMQGAAIGTTDSGGGIGAAAATQTQPPVQPRVQLGSAAAAAAAAAGTTASAFMFSEASQDEFGAVDWGDADAAAGGVGAAAVTGAPAFKAAAAARSAALGAAIVAFRPTWCPGPEGLVWSVLDVVPLRRFPELQAILVALHPMPHSAMQQQRDLHVVARSKRKNRRRRGDEPLSLALEWARPALRCLQGYLFTPLVYNPSPTPLPPSYWTNAEDDLMLYGMSRYGSNWRMIAETLLFSRNANQIANRHKNLNARNRPSDPATEDGSEQQQHLTRGAPAAATAAAAAAGQARKPKGAAAARSKGAAVLMQNPLLLQQQQQPAAAALQTGGSLAAALPVVAAMPGAGPSAAVAAGATLAPPPAGAPDLASMVQAARLVGLSPAVAAAHIMQAQQQLRNQPMPRPLPPPPPPASAPPPQVPFSVAIQLVAQLQKPGGMTGPAAAAARLLAAQLQEPSTAPAAVAALQLAAATAGPGAAGGSTAGLLPLTGVGEQGCGDGIGTEGGVGGEGAGPSLLAVAAQLLQVTGGAIQPPAPLVPPQLPTAQQAAALSAPFHPGLVAAPGGVALPLAAPAPAATPATQLQQLLPALLSLSQPTAAAAPGVLGAGPLAAAAAVAAVTGATAAPQPWATGLLAAAAGGAAAAAAAIGGSGADVCVSCSEQAATAVAVPGPADLHGNGYYGRGHEGPEGPEPDDPWHDHDHGSDEAMIWAQTPTSPFAHGADDSAATVAGLGADRLGAAETTLWQQPAYGATRLGHRPPSDSACGMRQAMAPAMPVAEAPLAAASPPAPAQACGGPSDPRLSHGKDLHRQQQHQQQQPPAAPLAQVVPRPGLQEQRLPSEHLAQHPPHPEPQPQQPRHGAVSPDANLLKLPPDHNHHNNHPSSHHNHHNQLEALPSLSDTFTLGGLSDLLGGGLRSGAATPATCLSPQGGLASICASHGHTMSLLLGSCLGVSALLRDGADGDTAEATPTKSAAAGPLRPVDGDNDDGDDGRAHKPPSSGRRGADAAREPQPPAKTTGHVDPEFAVGRDAGEVLGTPKRNNRPLQAPQLTQQQPLQSRIVAQLFSPKSPTSAGGAVARHRAGGGCAAAAPLQRLAALRGGIDVTPSSDPKAKRRSRVAATTLAEGAALPSPLEGTAQNDHRQGGGGGVDGVAAAAAVAPYRPRPALFPDEGGGSGGGEATAAAGSGRNALVAFEGQQGGDDEEGEAEGLARARKRLRLDAEVDAGGANAKALPLGSGGKAQLEPAGGVDVDVDVDLRGRCSVANSVAASPARPTASGASAGSSGRTLIPAAANAAAAAAVTVAAAAVKMAGKLAEGARAPEQPLPPLPKQQQRQPSSPQQQQQPHSADTGSSGGSKRRSVSGATTSGASTKRVATARGQAGGRAVTVEPGGARVETAAEAAWAAPHTATSAKVAIGRDASREPCRLSGHKRGRTGAGQKPPRLERGKDKALRAAAAGPTAEPLAVVDANANPAAPEAEAIAPGGVAPDGSCGVAGVSPIPAKPPGQRQHAVAAAAAAANATGRGAAATTESAAVPPSVSAAKPPKAPARKTGAGVQRLTRANAVAGGGGGRSMQARPPPSMRPPQPSSAAGAAAPAADVAAAAAPPLSQTSPRLQLQRIDSPLGAAVLGEVSCGGLSLHSLLCGGDTLDIASLLPCMSSRSLAALANPCSPASHQQHPRAPPDPAPGFAGPLIHALTPGSGAAGRAAAAAAAAAEQPPGFISSPHSHLLQLTPFAPSICTLGSLDLLPLFSGGNSADLWQALLPGSACGTTGRAPSARVVAGSTAGGDAAAAAPSTAHDSSMLTDPWSRFMAACSPTSHAAAALPPLPLPLPLPAAHRNDYSLSAFHPHLFSSGKAEGPPTLRDTAGASPSLPAPLAVTSTSDERWLPPSGLRPGREFGPAGLGVDGGSAGGGSGAVAGPPDIAAVEDAAVASTRPTAVEAAELGPVAAIGGDTRDQPPSGGASIAAAAAAAAAAATAAATAADASSAQPLPFPMKPRDGMEPIADGGLAAGFRSSSGPAQADSQHPQTEQEQQQQRNAVATAVGLVESGGTGHGKPPPAGSLLPPLPPPFPRHGSAPSALMHPPASEAHPPPPTETVRLFGRTVAKPLPITSPTMPARPQLLRAVTLAAAAAATAAPAAAQPVPSTGGECTAAAPQGDGVSAAAIAVGDNSNSRSRSQPETLPGPGLAQQAPCLEPLPPQPTSLPPLQTPAHGHPASGGGGGSPLHHILSPNDIPLGNATPGGFDTPLLAAAAPTPLQPPRVFFATAAGGATAAMTGGQETPATVAPAGAFAIPDALHHHAAVAVGAPLSLTPLPGSVATAAKTVGRRGLWETRLPHAAPGTTVGPSFSHWASNDHALGLEHERQGSGGLRASGGPGPYHSRAGGRRIAAAHAAAAVCAAAGGGAAASDTPGYVTCFSKVARRGPAAAVDPMALLSPSVMQPTPRARLDPGDEAEGGKAVGALQQQPLQRRRRKSDGDEEDGDDDSLLHGAGARDNEEDVGEDDVVRQEADAAREAVDVRADLVADAEHGDGDDELGGGEGVIEEAGDDPVDALPATVSSVAPAVDSKDIAASGGGAAGDRKAEVEEETEAAEAAGDGGPNWSKEQDQLVMREIFRLGEGASTWSSISQQLGGGRWSVAAVELRGRQLMARMFALM